MNPPSKTLFALLALAAVCISTPRGFSQSPGISGTINLSFTYILDGSGNVTGYSYDGASASLDINENIPIIINTTVNPSFENQPVLDWSNDFTWNNGLAIQFINGVNVAIAMNGDAEGEPSISDNETAIDAIVNTGPTEKTISVTPIQLTSPYLPGGELDFGATATFEFNVTIPSLANVVMDQGNVTVENLTVDSGGTLAANSSLDTREDLVNHGLITNLGGTIEGDFINDGTATGADAFIASNLTVQGNFINTGTIEIDSGGTLTRNANTLNAGSMILYGGSINCSGTFTNIGTFQYDSGDLSTTFVNSGNFGWSGGTIQNLTNFGDFTISGDNSKSIGTGGDLANSGTITHVGNANLLMSGYDNYGGDSGPFYYPAVLNNLAGGLYDLQSDAGIAPGQNYYSQDNTINNAGTFRKSGGTGVSTIAGGVTFNNTGIVEVDSGILEFDGQGSSTGGSFALNNGGLLRLASGFNFSGTTTASGNGTLEVPAGGNIGGPGFLDAGNGITVLVDGGGFGTNITLGGPGIFSWTSGPVTGATNTSPNFIISGEGAKTIYGALNNSGTITHVGNANLLMSGYDNYGGDSGPFYYPAVLNNLAGGLYDLQSDAGIAPGQSYYSQDNTINNAGTFRKSGGTGVSTIAGGVTFNNTGIVEVDSGILEFDGQGSSTGGSFALNNGGLLRLASGFNFSGTTTASGNGTLEVPAGGNIGGPGFLDAGNGITVLVDGGGFGTNITLGGPGIFSWTSGPVTGATNTSPNFIISGEGAKTIYGALNNSGTITHVGNANLLMSGYDNYGGDSGPFYYPAVLNNLAGGLYDLQSDAGIAPGQSYYSQDNTINNAGTFRKSGGTGVSTIAGGVTFNNTGIVEVDSGILEFDGQGSSTGGSFALNNGGLLRLASGFNFSGTTTASGNGTLEVPAGGNIGGPGFLDAGNGITVLVDGGGFGTNITLGGPGIFSWTSGPVTGATNTSPNFIISGEGAKTIYGALNNSGTITHVGSANLLMSGYDNYGGDSGPFYYPAVLNNLAGGLYDLQSDAGIAPGQSYYSQDNTINNAGTFRKSGGTGVSTIAGGVTFNNTGIVEVDSGILEFDGQGSSTGGSFALNNGGLLRLASGFNFSGTTTASGNGTLEVPAGGNIGGPGFLDAGNGITVLVDGGGFGTNITLGGPGIFSWTSGPVTGATNTSPNFIISGEGAKTIYGALNNSGTITHVGNANLLMSGYDNYGGDSGPFYYPAVLNNLAGGLYDLQSDAGIAPGQNYYSQDNTINNAGTFRKSGGTGVSTIAGGVTFNNTGIVEVDSGTLQIQGSVSQLSGNTLTGGAWTVKDNATLSLPGNITTNQGTVTLSGTNSVFANINGLSDNQGSFTITNGRNFATAGALQTSGQLNVGQGSILTLNGALTISNGSATVNGNVASSASVTVSAGATLGGNGTVGTTVNGAGTIAPGDPSILVINQVDPSTGMSFDFHFAQAGAPTYSNATSSGNDVLHLTGVAPLAFALTSANTVVMDFTGQVLQTGEIFYGGMFTDAAIANSMVANATFDYTGLDGATVQFEGMTPVASAPFATGTVSGGDEMEVEVMQGNAVPAAPAWALVVMGAGLLFAAGRRIRV